MASLHSGIGTGRRRAKQPSKTAIAPFLHNGAQKWVKGCFSNSTRRVLGCDMYIQVIRGRRVTREEFQSV